MPSFAKRIIRRTCCRFLPGTSCPRACSLLGDVVISVEKAKEQAKERRRTLDEEMVTLLIHGIVHLLGYDHERSAKDARDYGPSGKEDLQGAL